MTLPISPAEPLMEACESAISCLRHIHDRLVAYSEFETLRITINNEVRSLKNAIDKAEDSL